MGTTKLQLYNSIDWIKSKNKLGKNSTSLFSNKTFEQLSFRAFFIPMLLAAATPIFELFLINFILGSEKLERISKELSCELLSIM